MHASKSQLKGAYWLLNFCYSFIAMTVAIPHSTQFPVHEYFVVYSFHFPPHCPTLTTASVILIIDLATQSTKP